MMKQTMNDIPKFSTWEDEAKFWKRYAEEQAALTRNAENVLMFKIEQLEKKLSLAVDTLEKCKRRSQPPNPDDKFEDLARDHRHINSSCMRTLSEIHDTKMEY